MRFPFVSVHSYDWAVRHSERLADEADKANLMTERERWRAEQLQKKVWELTDLIVSMRKQNFVNDVPVTHVPLSTDEADEYAAEEDEGKRKAMLKRKLGT